MILYLSGPMTGLPDKNQPEFNRWARVFRERGHQVLNPAENDHGSTDKEWSFYMRLDIESLLQAEAIVLLPNWEYSKGAKAEVLIANTLKLKIYDVEDFSVNDKRAVPLGISASVFIIYESSQ